MGCAGVLTGHGGEVWCLRAHGSRLYSAGGDCTIKAWDIPTMSFIGDLIGHRNRVLALCLMGDRIFSGSSDLSVKVWDTQTLQCINSVTADGEVWCLAISGFRLFAGTSAGTIVVGSCSSLHDDAAVANDGFAALSRSTTPRSSRKSRSSRDIPRPSVPCCPWADSCSVPVATFAFWSGICPVASRCLS